MGTWSSCEDSCSHLIALLVSAWQRAPRVSSAALRNGFGLRNRRTTHGRHRPTIMFNKPVMTNTNIFPRIQKMQMSLMTHYSYIRLIPGKCKAMIRPYTNGGKFPTERPSTPSIQNPIPSTPTCRRYNDTTPTTQQTHTEVTSLSDYLDKPTNDNDPLPMSACVTHFITNLFDLGP